MKYISNSAEETGNIANDFVLTLQRKEVAVVVGLYGDLGAGKTTFTQSLANKFGIHERVVSPTFVIEKIYELTNQNFTHLIHIDAYRLDHSKELVQLGWEQILQDSNNVILIEWPEKVRDIMPEHIKIMISHGKTENSREIEIVM